MMGEGDTTEVQAQKAKCSFGRSFLFHEFMNISCMWVRLMRVLKSIQNLNLNSFQRRKYAWDGFLLYSWMFFSSRLFFAWDISSFWICGPGNYNNINAAWCNTQVRHKNTSIAPYFEALKVGLHTFFPIWIWYLDHLHLPLGQIWYYTFTRYKG